MAAALSFVVLAWLAASVPLAVVIGRALRGADLCAPGDRAQRPVDPWQGAGARTSVRDVGFHPTCAITMTTFRASSR